MGNVYIMNCLEDGIIEIQTMLNDRIESNQAMGAPEMNELSDLLNTLRDMVARIEVT